MTAGLGHFAEGALNALRIRRFGLVVSDPLDQFLAFRRLTGSHELHLRQLRRGLRGPQRGSTVL